MPPDDLENTRLSSEYSFTTELLATGLDPNLQNIVFGQRACRPTADLRSSETGGQELPENEELHENQEFFADQELRIDVLARVNDPGQPLPVEFEVVQRIGDVATGTVRVKDIVPVREHENILSLKAARKVYATLDSSVPEICASRSQLRATFEGKKLDGARVIVGVVDHGCDFAHPNFINEQGTRILYLWDQRRTSAKHKPPAGYPYGREFDSKAINDALAWGSPECYQHLDYEPGSAHGTRVLDIAAGSGTDTNPAGVAPKADIIFVDVTHDDIGVAEPFGSSRHLLEAIKYIFDKAKELEEKEGLPRSVVVNVSLNSDGGPHDGSTPFERGIDYLLQTPGRAVVIAAGNSAGQEQGAKRHAGRLIQPGQTVSLSWRILEADETDNIVDIWYDGKQELEVSLISPGGRTVGVCPLCTMTTICRREVTAARIIHRHNDPNNNDNEIVIIFSPLMEPGVWRIQLRSLSKRPFMLHAWVESDNVKQSGFEDLPASDDAYTIGSIACGHSSIAVGAYFTSAPNDILPQSSEGPTRDGKLKPEVSAPGANAPSFAPRGGGIIAARIMKNFSTRGNGGTSAAAPHVAGLIALLMQNAAAPLPVSRIRQHVIDNTRRDPLTHNSAWHPRLGMGRVDALGSLIAQASTQPDEIFNVAAGVEEGLPGAATDRPPDDNAHAKHRADAVKSAFEMSLKPDAY